MGITKEVIKWTQALQQSQNVYLLEDGVTFDEILERYQKEKEKEKDK